MPYVIRDKNGVIQAIHATPPKKAKAEWIAPEQMDDVINFLNASPNADQSYTFMQTSDLELVRVLEDLIDLLCNKHIISFTEFPETAQHKLTMRKQVRKNMEGFANLINEDEKDIF